MGKDRILQRPLIHRVTLSQEQLDGTPPQHKNLTKEKVVCLFVCLFVFKALMTFHRVAPTAWQDFFLKFASRSRFLLMPMLLGKALGPLSYIPVNKTKLSCMEPTPHHHPLSRASDMAPQALVICMGTTTANGKPCGGR